MGLLQLMDGRFWLSSSPGHGTTASFMVRLPLGPAPELQGPQHGIPAGVTGVAEARALSASRSTEELGGPGGPWARAGLAGEPGQGAGTARGPEGAGAARGPGPGGTGEHQEGPRGIGDGTGLGAAARGRPEQGASAGRKAEVRAPEEGARQTPAEGRRQPPAFPPRALRVLVAEDNKVNQLLIRKLLGHHGHHVSTPATLISSPLVSRELVSQRRVHRELVSELHGGSHHQCHPAVTQVHTCIVTSRRA